jgi:hypothetical protein
VCGHTTYLIFAKFTDFEGPVPAPGEKINRLQKGLTGQAPE